MRQGILMGNGNYRFESIRIHAGPEKTDPATGSRQLHAFRPIRPKKLMSLPGTADFPHTPIARGMSFIACCHPPAIPP